MVPEQRIRESLRREADSIDPNVAWGLERVQQGRRVGRGATRLRTASDLAIVAIIVVGIVALAGYQGLQSNHAAIPPTPAGASPTIIGTESIAGTYGANLSDTNSAVHASGLAGQWQMVLRTDGGIDLTSPPTFTAEGQHPTGIAYTINGQAFRTNLFANDFCDSVGNYTWSRPGASLVFVTDTDACAIRITLLTASPWQLKAPA